MALRILKKLGGFFSGGGARGTGERGVFYLYVRCGKCGEKVRVRVNTGNDLSRDYDRGTGDAGSGYVLRKDIMDSKCFRIMHAEVQLDDAHRIISKEISGGQFITQEEYEKEG